MTTMLTRLSVALVLLAALAFMSGCGTGCPRTADPSAGDFYTDEEFQQLTKEQREQYCSALLNEYQASEDCVAQAQDDLAMEKQAIGDLETELSSLEPRLRSLKGEVEELRSEIAYFEGLPRVYVVQKGDFLYKISEMEPIYADPMKWKRIWRANKDRIDGFTDPNLIYPDWELVIPRDWPHTHTVQAGENLWQIARYWEVYEDGKMWERIYEANKDKISNPDVIQPGWVLTIPR
jgi:nucleoid-associated protein YgaU